MSKLAYEQKEKLNVDYGEMKENLGYDPRRHVGKYFHIKNSLSSWIISSYAKQKKSYGGTA